MEVAPDGISQTFEFLLGKQLLCSFEEPAFFFPNMPAKDRRELSNQRFFLLLSEPLDNRVHTAMLFDELRNEILQHGKSGQDGEYDLLFGMKMPAQFELELFDDSRRLSGHVFRAGIGIQGALCQRAESQAVLMFMGERDQA